MASRLMRVVVVGAGLGGLSAACHLAGAGHDVTVIESFATPGGVARGMSLGGYRFETGPTVMTMPHILERTFQSAGVEMADLLHIKPLDPMYSANFPDGSTIRARAGTDAMTEEIRSVCGSREAAAFDRFATWLEELYQAEMPVFIDRNYNSVFDLVALPRLVMRLVRLGAFRHLEPKVRSFFQDERLVRLFSFQALYAGMAPADALAVFSVITYMDSIAGVFCAEGGMSAVAEALAAAATKAGTTFLYDCPAERIELAGDAGGHVRGVRLASGQHLPADAVVCTADLATAYRTLLPGLRPPSMVTKGKYSPSAVVWHVGARGDLPSGTRHHNLFFGHSWQSAFTALVEQGCRMPDPSLLLTVASLDDPALAPAGGHTLYVLEPVPNLGAPLNWANERCAVHDSLLARLQGLGFPSTIEVEALTDPCDWAEQGYERGTPFGLAHFLRQSGPFRPSNIDKRAPGLVFAGANTVPGIGVPMVLLSGRLAAERVMGMSA